MPRLSKKMMFMKNFENELNSRRQFLILRFLMDSEDDFEDEIDEWMEEAYERSKKVRYLFRSSVYRSKPHRWKVLLEDTTLLNEAEFLHQFQMSRSSFYSLMTIVNNHNKYTHNFKSMEEVHLLTLLKFLGSHGNSASFSSIGCDMGIGYGSVSNYIETAIAALLQLKKNVVFWPGKKEREEISQRFNQEYSFVNCIGIIDGTIFPLEFKPPLNGEDYYHRKGGYGLHSLVLCDDKARIRGITMGWPGSVHDNRVWKRCEFMTDQKQYFDARQYILGDSAFHPSNIMIPAFKKPFGKELDEYKKFFNTMLAKPCIKSEHCIGLLKGRFPYLKRIRVLIKGKKSMICINRILHVATILHNLMIEQEYPIEWVEKDEEYNVDDELEADTSPNDER